MKYYISEIDLLQNKGKTLCFDVAMRKVYKHIVAKIDPTFPEDQFQNWYVDGAEKPFKWNNNRFYWSNDA